MFEKALQAVDLGRTRKARGQLGQINGFDLEQGDDESRQAGDARGVSQRSIGVSR